MYGQSYHSPEKGSKLFPANTFRWQVINTVPVARSPFVRKSFFSRLRKRLLIQLISFNEYLFKKIWYVHDDNHLLYQLSPETRKLLQYLIKHDLLENWYFGRVAPAVPHTRALILRPGSFKGPNGQAYALSGANGVGVGPTYDAAAKPALGEHIERLSSAGFWWEDPRIFSAKYNPKNKKMLDPTRFLFLSDDQKNDALFKDRLASGFDYQKQTIRWQYATHFLTGKRYYVPASLCYMFSPTGMQSDPYYPEVTSNGVAAHTDRIEAQNRALLEYIERDVLMRAWYHKRAGKKISLQSLTEYFSEAAEIAAADTKDIKTYIIDLTDDLNVPTLVGVQTSTDPRVRTLVFTAASDLQYDLALEKVLAEIKRFMNLVYYTATKPMPDTYTQMREQADSFAGRGGLWAHAEMLPYMDWFVQCPEVAYSDIIQSSKAQALPDGSYKNRKAYLQEVCHKHDLSVYMVEFKNTVLKYSGLKVVRAVTDDLVPVFFDEKNRPLRLRRFTHKNGHPVTLNPAPHPYL